MQLPQLRWRNMMQALEIHCCSVQRFGDGSKTTVSAHFQLIESCSQIFEATAVLIESTIDQQIEDARSFRGRNKPTKSKAKERLFACRRCRPWTCCCGARWHVECASLGVGGVFCCHARVFETVRRPFFLHQSFLRFRNSMATSEFQAYLSSKRSIHSGKCMEQGLLGLSPSVKRPKSRI